jgi:hypothetical protein
MMGSIVAVPVRSRCRTASSRYSIWHCHEDDGVVIEAGVGAQQQEQVRETGHGDAHVRPHAAAPGPARVRPSRPRVSRAIRGSVTLKPVPTMMVSV